jgi:hypothetical protein
VNVKHLHQGRTLDTVAAQATSLLARSTQSYLCKRSHSHRLDGLVVDLEEDSLADLVEALRSHQKLLRRLRQPI